MEKQISFHIPHSTKNKKSMNEIQNLNPTCIWKNFYALTQVPRPSGHLEKVQQFLLDFAKEAGVEAFKDPADNIVMRKPASPGMEKKKGVILQAHMDMVPQKTPESTHDFVTDPIQPWIDGEWVKAKGTTLVPIMVWALLLSWPSWRIRPSNTVLSRL